MARGKFSMMVTVIMMMMLIVMVMMMVIKVTVMMMMNLKRDETDAQRGDANAAAAEELVHDADAAFARVVRDAQTLGAAGGRDSP